MKVLVALDGSAPSLVARDLIAGLPWPPDTTVHLVAAYLVPNDYTGGVGSTMDWIGDAEDAMRDRLHDELRTAGEPLAERGLKVDRVVVAGRAADVITDAARRLEVDVIVTGSRGRGPLTSMLLGSVANEVASHAPCPVLVARAPTVSRVLVATDGSPSAAAIPNWLEKAGILRDLPADVVAVSIPDNPGFGLIVELHALGDERLAVQRRELDARHQADAKAMAERLAALGMQAEPSLRAGDPAHEILATATERGADLIVVGSRGLEGLERLLLGSVARNVLVHARCSVLIVRSGTADDAG
jgi:nucleotide-binding universal stress UspA family protein